MWRALVCASAVRHAGARTPLTCADDVRTWDSFPGFPDTGVIYKEGVGQSPFLWHMRSLPAVRRAFALCWDSEDLITSFDGCGVFRPFQYRPAWRTASTWYHVDQGAPCFARKGWAGLGWGDCAQKHFFAGRTKSGQQCVQGLVSLYDQDATTGGLVVVPKSQRAHDELMELAKNNNGGPHCAAQRAKGAEYTRTPQLCTDFMPIPPGHAVLESEQPILVCCKAGDLVLWDSRTVHCNTPALVAPREPRPEKVTAAAASGCRLALKFSWAGWPCDCRFPIGA